MQQLLLRYSFEYSENRKPRDISLITSRSKLMSLGYTEKEVNDLIIFAGFSINNNMLNQMRSAPREGCDILRVEIPFDKVQPNHRKWTAA